ncbi:VanZ family protein [uncultured Draconibacterium sp.]|uniref:VanZ family protein n=1 Tax=uncultured Draconibacterium sp. TaxID=1573823 RepID=UPI0032176FB0
MNISRLIYQIVLVLWVAGLAFLALASHSMLRGNIIVTCCHNDHKHFIGAFVLAILAYNAFRLPSFKITLIVWSILSVLFELAQHLITEGKRSFELIDIVYNITGFALGVAVLYLFKRYRKTREIV